MRFRILHTNDVHSRFEAFARAAALIKAERDGNTLVLDAGDFNDFMRIDLQGTHGQAGTDLLRLAGYDALAVGNNETFAFLDELEAMATNSQVPFLSCNITRKDWSPVKGLKKSIIIQRGGVRFLIIGISPGFTDFLPLMGMNATDTPESIQKEIEDHRGQYDISILLSHVGYKYDLKLAQELRGLNIIIGGHSHTLMETAEIVNGVIIHQSGYWAEHLGIAEFEWDGDLRLVRAENVKSAGTPEDPEIMAAIARNREIAIDNLSQPLFEIDRDLWHDVVEENPISNLLADAFRDVLGTEIGLVNAGLLNGGVRKGWVTRKKIVELCPSPLNPTSFEIQGRYLREALEQALRVEHCMADGAGAGYRGKYAGRLHVSGMEIRHDGRHIVGITVNGEPLDDERWYRVGSHDYLQRGSAYPSLANNRNVRYNAEYCRERLQEYLAKPEYREKAFTDRWVRV
jgi:2',3'-cyclic-nucleotide 2'-phosphodiesterase (5'-nucleotidase family)